MASDFTMPKLGLTMTDGTIREWLVADGTLVQIGDPVLIIETDKVETEVEARETGVLTITGVVGENYDCGAVIGHLGNVSTAPATGPAAAPTSAAAAPPAEPAAPEPIQAAAAPVQASAPAVALPQGKDIAARGEGGRILASPRARAAARSLGVTLEPIAGTGPGGRILAADVEAFAQRAPATSATAHHAASNGSSDVAARGEGGRILASPRARAAAKAKGVELEQIAGSGPGGRIVADDVAAHTPAEVSPPQPAPVEAQSTAVTAAPVAESPAPGAVAPATPMVGATSATAGGRMLAELLGIDLRQVPPASPDARVTREDVARWVRLQLAESPPAAAKAIPAPVASSVTSATPLLQEPTTVVPLRGMRGVIAERMHASLSEMAQLSLSVDADMTEVNAARARLKADQNTVPGYTAWVIAAASRALRDHPYVNSQVTSDGVAYLPDIHVGVAVALDEGLIVPVIKNTERAPVADVHEQVADLAGRARDGKLKLEELEGGTFSVTALGMYGVDMFTPVINPPNTAILGVGRLRTETRWTDGSPSPTTVMTLSLTWDHRAFDGAPAAEFAQSIAQYLENPTQLVT